MKNYIVGIDIGTQGTKCMLFDTDMNVIGSAFEGSKLISPKPGVVWQETDDIFMSCVRTIKQIIEETGIDPKNILSISIDGQMAGIIGVDKNGEAVTPYDSWLDNRCGKYLDIIKERVGKKMIEISGGPATYDHAPKVIWWKNEEKEIYDKISKFVVPHAYVAGKMAGLSADELFMDYTCIAFSGFGDSFNKKWSNELLKEFNIEENKFPEIVSPFKIVGKTTKEFAELCGLCEGIPIAAGAGDTAASTFGAGHFEENMLLDCAGTASNLCAVVNEYVPDVENETLIMLRSPIDGLFLPLAYINGGGLCVRWFRDEFTGDDKASYDILENEAKGVATGSEGILFVPHFAGRVLPNDPYVKGCFVGLDWKHKRGHLYRAVLEGIAYEYKNFFGVLKKLYPNAGFNTMRGIGGGCKSSLFNSIKADVLGVNSLPLKLGDAALVGSAVIGAVGAGVFSDHKEPILKTIENGKMIEYNDKNHMIYADYAEAYNETYSALRGVYKNRIYK